MVTDSKRIVNQFYILTRYVCVCVCVCVCLVISLKVTCIFAERLGRPHSYKVDVKELESVYELAVKNTNVSKIYL